MLPAQSHTIFCPQGMPGKDGRDGVPGLDGEKVGIQLAACRGGGVFREFSLLGLSTPFLHNLLQGEAGRNGAPGEKGPNGLPVSARGFLQRPQGLCQGALPGQGCLLWVPEWGLMQGSLH